LAKSLVKSYKIQKLLEKNWEIYLRVILKVSTREASQILKVPGTTASEKLLSNRIKEPFKTSN
jgi:hypothetical protein